MEVNNTESKITPDAKEIIRSFQEFQKEATLENANKFIKLLLTKIDIGHDPKFGVSTKSIQDLLNTGGTLSFATGTLGDRIHFYNYDSIGDLSEPIDAPVKCMTYPVSDVTFDYQKNIHNRWNEIFGSDKVDLSQKIE